MPKSFWVVILLIVALGLFSFLRSSFLRDETRDTEGIELPKEVSIAGKVIEVELALSPEEKARGLSGREELPEDRGMLFVFDKPDFYGFWMKDMLISLDIIWISLDFKVVHIEKNVSPETYPEVFVPSAKAQYVLEVNSGFSDANDLKVGDKVEFLEK